MKTEAVNKYSAPSVATAIDILTFLSKYKNRDSTLTEISKGIEVNSSTCYRILQTLVTQKILSYKEETKKFSLGPYLIVLGSRASEFVNYLEIAREYLGRIAEFTNSTTAIVQRIGDEWIYIDKKTPDSPYSITIKVGQRFPLNAGASAKLIMSYLPREEQEEILDRIGLKKYTQTTKGDKDEFLKELPMIRAQGYSVSEGEHYDGISGICLPVINKSGELEFAITIIMLKKKKEELIEIAHQVKRLTDELSSLI